MRIAVQPDIDAYLELRSHRVIDILRDLVRIPSVNKAPSGSEGACQRYIAGFLSARGWNPAVYRPDEAPGITSHALYWKGRDYTDRPNVAACRKGSGGGRSLILSGHIDTVPVGSKPWVHDPFGAQIEGNRLYGRGSNDMKCGIATNLFVAEALTELNVRFSGDVTVESVADEEFGGVNGTLAGRLAGYNADAAVISEPSFLRVCPAQRGGRTVHITFSAQNEGILGGVRTSAVEQVRIFLNAAEDFARMRRSTVKIHPLYAHLSDPVPATITNIHTAPWGTSEPTRIPDECKVEFFWQAMPGETQEEIDREFFEWFNGMIDAHPEVFTARPEIVHPIRWLPGSAVSENECIVRELSACAAQVTGAEPAIQGIEGPCDMYVFHHFGIPAVLWGARGGNTHNADEYVEIDSVIQAAKVLLMFACRWCGVSN
jgi:acetylornithine deacetylase